MININDTNLEDTVPTYDADVDVLELLHDATVLGLDDDGNEIPGYVFADTLSDLLGLSVEDLVDFAKENEYNIYTAKINGEELPANIFVICAKGCDIETIKNDYKDIYELDIELSAVENDAESKEDELTEKLTNESIKPAIDWLNSIYFGLEDTKDDDNWFFSCWSHVAHFGPSWPSGQSVMAIQIDNDVEHIHIGYGDIETSEEFDYAVNSLKDELRKRTGEKNDDISITETVGGKSKEMSAEDIAKKHSVDIKQIEDQLEIGVKIEKEHTDSDEKARRIALDHLFEIPDYYDRLVKMEKEAGLKEGYYSDDTVQSIKQQIESVAKSSDAIKAKTQQDFYKCLGWLALNVISITADIPLDVKDVFIKRFGNQPESAVRFIDIAELADSYSTGYFNKSTSIRLFSIYQCPKELKELIEKDSLEIKNFTLAKTLIKLYGFKFGDNDPDLNVEHIMAKLSGSQEKMDAFERGFSLVDINKKESSLEDGIKEFATIVNQDDEDWLTQHVRTIRIEVPDFLEKKFKFLFPDAVAHEDYVVKSTKIRTSGGYLSKWAVSAVLSVDTTDGAPEWLLPYFKEKKISNTSLVLSLVSKYGFEFGKNQKIQEENELSDRAKRHKKTDKKGARGWFVNPNAGNVKQNIVRANHMMGDGSTASSETVGSAPAGLGEDIEDVSVDESIEKHDTLNPKLWDANELKSEVKEKIQEIVDTFIEGLKDDDVAINVTDVVIVGSNCSYNYTDKSDLDVHIKCSTKDLKCPDNLYSLLYSAYRSIFNKKYDIEFYGINVELFIETEDSTVNSNGVYSLNTGWIKEPVKEDIPEFDEEKFNVEFNKWEDRYFDIIQDEEVSNEKPIESVVESVDTNTTDKLEEIDNFIEDIYDLRKESIAKEGEYGLGNLVFKELRNLDYLDNLKTLKAQLKSKELSLESLYEADGGLSDRSIFWNIRDGLVNDKDEFINKTKYSVVAKHVLDTLEGNLYLNNGKIDILNNPDNMFAVSPEQYPTHLLKKSQLIQFKKDVMGKIVMFYNSTDDYGKEYSVLTAHEDLCIKTCKGELGKEYAKQRAYAKYINGEYEEVVVNKELR